MTGLAACVERTAPPAPVIHLGGVIDSVGGAIKVDRGDTVWRISQRYRLSLRDIIDLNQLQPPYRLTEGMRLKLPVPREHAAGDSDTLHNISRMYHVPISQLIRINKLQSPYHLQVGQVVRLPSARQGEEVAVITPTPEKPLIQETAAAPQKQIKKKPLLPRQDKVTSMPIVAGSDWPVRGRIISSYGPKEGGFYNEGVNIAAPRGTPIKAFGDGVVAYVGDDLGSYGNLVLIRHSQGMVTAYAHMAAVTVTPGMSVKKGQVIGAVGSTGTVANAQLHFEIRKNGDTIDPAKYLSKA